MNGISTQKLAVGSVAISLLVLTLKMLAWWMTGSVALYSDALESFVNVVGALIAWFALRYAQKPPDRGHHYGHHKAEYFSAVAEGAMIVAAAILIAQEAILSFAQVTEADLGPVGLGVNAIAMVVNLAWARVLLTAGRDRNSPALTASGRHLMSDVWTSAGVLVGLVLAIATGWAILDPLLALLVAMNILREGFGVIASSMSGLMDKAVTPEEQETIAEIVHRSGGGAMQIHDIKTRRAGQAMFVEFHMVVDGEMTVRTSHGICDRLEAAIRAELPEALVTIHVEPEHHLKPEGIEPAAP